MSEGNNISILNLSYVREVDNKNLLSGELEKTFNLTPLFLLVSSACKQSLTRFGHHVCNACCASLFASLQANKCVTCGKIAFSKQFYPRPLLARRGKEKEVIIRDCHVALLLSMTAILFPFSAYATCTPTPDCASIGYTETSCETISLKCPFDQTKLYCFPCDSSFQYSCSNHNEYGDGTSCKGKYKSCCNTDCVVGNIYYSDGTCNSCLDTNKKPIGIVVKDNELIMSKITQIVWGISEYDIDTLPNITTHEEAKTDFNGIENTSLLVTTQISEGLTSTTSATLYCNEYAPTGLESSIGQWYLPAIGELYAYVYSNYNTIKPTLKTMNWLFDNEYCFWSSSEFNHSGAWCVYPHNGILGGDLKSDSDNVTCFHVNKIISGILEFLTVDIMETNGFYNCNLAVVVGNGRIVFPNALSVCAENQRPLNLVGILVSFVCDIIFVGYNDLVKFIHNEKVT